MTATAPDSRTDPQRIAIARAALAVGDDLHKHTTAFCWYLRSLADVAEAYGILVKEQEDARLASTVSSHAAEGAALEAREALGGLLFGVVTAAIFGEFDVTEEVARGEGDAAELRAVADALEQEVGDAPDASAAAREQCAALRVFVASQPLAALRRIDGRTFVVAYPAVFEL